ncbi:MAG: heptaprenyl diphosphate synthase, partial [Lysinibacillus sp.]
EAERQQLLKAIRKSDAIKRASALSDRYLEKALLEVEQLPNNPVKKSLVDIAVFMGKRKF